MKNKLPVIITDIIIIILGIIFLVFGIKDFIAYDKKFKVDDATKFRQEFSYVSENHIYEYLSLKEFVKIFKSKKTAIILIGNNEDAWTQVLVEPLNEIVKNHNNDKNYKFHMETIYYFNTLEDYTKDKKNYNYLISKYPKEEWKTPTIIFIEDGVIKQKYTKYDIYDKTSDDIPLEYWNDERKKELKENIYSFYK